MYIKSTTCYSYVRDKGNIILPSVRQLQRVASGLNVTPGLSTLANENYLRGRCKELKDHEKQVVLQIDEIFIKSAITYKCNTFIGLTKKGEAATTIQCFLYSSLLSKNKEIVSLNPVKNMNAEDLHSMTLEILSLTEKVGFSVVCIVSDNNRVNRNCFSKLCNGTIKSDIQNPANNAKKLRLIFNSVYLIKSIRNNWLNQKDADSSLMYPDPSGFSQIRKTSFSSLFKIYNEEMNIVKLAPKLCLKALKPTNFEKQNVKLVLKIFEESNVTALNILIDKLGYKEMFRDNAIFIKHILDFWQIMNIKNPTKRVKILN
ncbi:transposable element P transposase [Trichonephila clavipes]|uniref:Transposable element P transposase n=1 Tax=Trichonephila clavipes TaxID=2585209 RepID=A0A8X7BJD5_TRICX|nr:transposable element P transposase [Trichonephila clavipes]